jgi:hypothetical protein
VSLPDLWHLRTLLGCGTACRSGTVAARSFFARVRVSCAWVWVLVWTVCLPKSADQKTPSEQAASVVGEWVVDAHQAQSELVLAIWRTHTTANTHARVVEWTRAISACPRGVRVCAERHTHTLNTNLLTPHVSGWGVSCEPVATASISERPCRTCRSESTWKDGWRRRRLRYCFCSLRDYSSARAIAVVDHQLVLAKCTDLTHTAPPLSLAPASVSSLHPPTCCSCHRHVIPCALIANVLTLARISASACVCCRPVCSPPTHRPTATPTTPTRSGKSTTRC